LAVSESWFIPEGDAPAGLDRPPGRFAPATFSEQAYGKCPDLLLLRHCFMGECV
jgi:hypothetical protein